MHRLINKRILLAVATAALTLVIATVVTWLYVGRVGTTDLENWIGRQIVGVLSHHITPRVQFKNLDYQVPRTVVVENLILTAHDRPILQVDWARLELAEVPQRGRPIKVQHIELNTPRLQFIVDAQGNLVGWSDFVKEEAIEHPEKVPTGQRLSDVLVLRHIGIQEGQLIYEDEGNEADRMTLPGINVQLDTPPDAQNPEWHQLLGRLRHDPLIDLELEGRINLDTGLLEIARFQLAAAVGEEQYGTLPPALQNFLRRHEVQGQLIASGQGQIPLDNPASTSASVEAELTDARFRYGETVLPVSTVRLNAQLPDEGIELTVEGVNLAAQQRSFFSVERLSTRVSGIPAEGEPLIIESLEVDRPRVEFATDPGGRLRGWSDLTDIPDLEDRGETDPGQILRAVRLEQFRINAGAVTYHPAALDEPLTVDGIDIALSGEPQENDPEILALTGTLRAGALLEADLGGQLNTNTAVLNLNRFQAVTEIHPDQYDRLPPQARDWVARHEVQGRISASGEATIPLHEPAQTQLEAGVEITAARLRYNDVSIPIGRAQAQLHLPQRTLEAAASDFAMIAGEAPFLAFDDLTATIRFPEDSPIVVDQVRITRPALALVAGPDGEFEGWSRLPLEHSGEDQRGSDGPQVDVGNVEIREGTFTYAPQPDLEPLQLAGINLTVRQSDQNADILQLTGSVSEGWVQAQLAGQLDMDTRTLGIDEFQASTTIRQEDHGQLPQVLQEIVVPIQFAGEITLSANGTIPLDEPSAAQGDLRAELRSGSLSHEGLHVPVSEASVDVSLPDGPFTLAARDVTVRHQADTLLHTETISLESQSLPWGQAPVRIDRIRLEKPALELVQRPEGGLAGWSELGQLTPETPTAQTPPTETPPAPQEPDPQSADGSASFIDRYVLDRLEIAGAQVSYSGPHTRGPLVLDDVDGLLLTRPSDEPAALDFSGQIRQSPLLSVDFEGRYDADARTLTFSTFSANAEIDEEGLAAVPQTMRESLVRQQLGGRFTASWQGTVPLGTSDGQPTGRLQLTANAARLPYSDLVWAVDGLQLQADLPNGPATASAEGLSISTGETQIFSTAALDARLAQLGDTRQPMHIQSVSLESPRLSLLALNQGFVGWDRLGGDGDPQAEPGPRPIIQQLQIRDGELVYAAAPDQAQMVLSGLDLDARLQAPDTDWYALTGRIQRAPLLDADLNGRLNLDEPLLDIQSLRLRAQLAGQQPQVLPPQIQTLVREYAIQGAISVEAQGRVPLEGFEQLDGKVTAAGQNITVGEAHWPIDQLNLTAQADQGAVTARVNAALLGGRLEADADAAMHRDGTFNLKWQAQGLRLENMGGAQGARHAGVLSSRGQLRGRLGTIPDSFSGSGELSVEQGRLMRIPIIEGVVSHLITTPVRLPGLEDRAQAQWQFRPDHLDFTKLNVNSPLISLDGTGQVFYDQRVDLGLRAEVLQRLPRALGDVGKLLEDIGRIGGQVVTYRVTGTISDPRIIPTPLGIGGR